MQIQAACVSGAQKLYGMSHAILLYGERGGTVFASVHDIQTKNDGVATIAAGTPVSKDRPREDDANPRAGGLCAGRVC